LVKDTLFLLTPGFVEDGRTYFCPICAQIEGVLAYMPTLREKVDVRYVAFPRPRAEIVALVGEANQKCPVLVLGDSASVPDGIEAQAAATGLRFISHSDHITRYLSALQSGPVAYYKTSFSK
jgi:hypothetical protein